MTKSVRLKSVLWIIVIAFFFLSLKQAQSENIKESKESDIWGQDVDGKAISIRTDKMAYAPEEPIRLYLKIKNVGKEPLTIGFEDRAFWDYEIGVSGPKEEKTDLTGYGREESEKKSLSGSTASRTIEPGKDFSLDLSISRIYDFSVAQNYTIVVHKAFFTGKKGSEKVVKVISNKLEIKVDNHLPFKE